MVLGHKEVFIYIKSGTMKKTSILGPSSSSTIELLYRGHTIFGANIFYTAKLTSLLGFGGTLKIVAHSPTIYIPI
jgi:hypothetical protein